MPDREKISSKVTSMAPTTTRLATLLNTLKTTTAIATDKITSTTRNLASDEESITMPTVLKTSSTATTTIFAYDEESKETSVPIKEGNYGFAYLYNHVQKHQNHIYYTSFEFLII